VSDRRAPEELAGVRLLDRKGNADLTAKHFREEPRQWLGYTATRLALQSARASLSGRGG
jgi:hypothetical protein